MANSYNVRPLAETDDEPARATQMDNASITTLSAGEGAQVTTRKNAGEAATRARANAGRRSAAKRLKGDSRPSYGTKRSDSTEIDRRQIIILAVSALVVVAILGILLSRAFNSLAPAQGDAQQTQQSEQSQSSGGMVTEEAGIMGLSAKYDDATISVEKRGDGTYGIMATGADATNPILLFTVPGEPAALLVEGRRFIVPENVDGGWDVFMFTWGGEDAAARLMNADGTAFSGSGTVADAHVDGGVLTIMDSTGETAQLSLD